MHIGSLSLHQLIIRRFWRSGQIPSAALELIAQLGVGKALLYAMPVVTFGLGMWQARKVTSKKEHLEQLKTRSKTFVELPARFVVRLRHPFHRAQSERGPGTEVLPCHTDRNI